MNTRTAGLILGIVFIVVGILGFIPNPIISEQDGAIFKVNLLHNIVHLASGAVILAGVYSFGSALGLKIIGVVYAVVAILGLVMRADPMFGIAMNMADHVLHVVLAVVILYAGFALPDGGKASTAMA
jgi:hypothetical protein